MSKKLGKSVFTTGVAATTLFSALAGHKAQAEEITQKDAADQQSTDMTGMDSSFMDMNILNEQLLKAEKRVEDQRLRLNQAQSEYNVAKSGLKLLKRTYRILKQGFKTPIKAPLAKLKMKLRLQKQLLLWKKTRYAKQQKPIAKSVLPSRIKRIKSLPNSYSLISHEMN